jgi:hypothetical protein
VRYLTLSLQTVGWVGFVAVNLWALLPLSKWTR